MYIVHVLYKNFSRISVVFFNNECSYTEKVMLFFWSNILIKRPLKLLFLKESDRSYVIVDDKNTRK
jgi:hypothetical protein